MDALSVRRTQQNREKKDLHNIVKVHYKNVNELISSYKKEKNITYVVGNFIPGFKEYNSTLVTERLMKILKKERYGIHRLADNMLIISWRLSDKENMKLYIKKLLINIYKLINDRMKNNYSHLEYAIPFDFMFPPNKTKELVTKVLKTKKFNVNDGLNGSIVISW